MISYDVIQSKSKNPESGSLIYKQAKMAKDTEIMQIDEWNWTEIDRLLNDSNRYKLQYRFNWLQ